MKKIDREEAMEVIEGKRESFPWEGQESWSDLIVILLQRYEHNIYSYRDKGAVIPIVEILSAYYALQEAKEEGDTILDLARKCRVRKEDLMGNVYYSSIGEEQAIGSSYRDEYYAFAAYYLSRRFDFSEKEKKRYLDDFVIGKLSVGVPLDFEGLMQDLRRSVGGSWELAAKIFWVIKGNEEEESPDFRVFTFSYALSHFWPDMPKALLFAGITEEGVEECLADPVFKEQFDAASRKVHAEVLGVQVQKAIRGDQSAARFFLKYMQDEKAINSAYRINKSQKQKVLEETKGLSELIEGLKDPTAINTSRQAKKVLQTDKNNSDDPSSE